MIQDLHSHTYYSFCGKDCPEEVIEKAIEGGIHVLGICDHCYGIAHRREGTVFLNEEKSLLDYQRAVNAYHDHIRCVSEKYKNEIRTLVGIEIPTINKPHLIFPKEVDISFFDYCLIEHIDRDDTVAPDLFAFISEHSFPKVGIAHTDLFSYLKKGGKDPLSFFSRLKEHGIFWEMNVNFDSVHKYRVLPYVAETLESRSRVEILKKSGVSLSVGFDGHRIADYLPEKVIECCEKITSLSLPLVNI